MTPLEVSAHRMRERYRVLIRVEIDLHPQDEQEDKLPAPEARDVSAAVTCALLGIAFQTAGRNLMIGEVSTGAAMPYEE